MTSVFKRIGLAALVTLGGLTATISYSSAAEPGYGPARDFANNPASIVQVQYRDHHGDRDWRRDRHHGRPGCSPGWATEKASRMGLRRARVVDVSHRVVVVAGRGWHGPDRIVFANERGCPVIRR
ncbi:hypothetical protein [Neorhizobium sp. NCHU2750]|uniref:hypothetical protein n=1 Tax=Neorhizobium sp. NCHU2750 TaxID=1825976 RepID=UPI000E76C41A|nr:hypothetical protein NCHU2750_22140 [Neorhizobium sp. NCHU2750]